MTANSIKPQRSRWRIPEGDRQALIEPAFDQVAIPIDANRHSREQCNYDLNGRRLKEISQLARSELLAAARRWTSSYRDVADTRDTSGGLIFLAGHQPEMVHPGVWLKNFALGELARRHGAAAVHIIVDSDVVSEMALSVPGGTVSEPSVAPIAFDRNEPKIPYEERQIEDRTLFESFGRRAIEQLKCLVAEPLVERYWPLVVARSRETGNLGACLSQARHQLEGFWEAGSPGNLEVPQSEICRGEAFQWFVSHLLARLPKFRAIYNEALQSYRREHRIRSLHHPAPDLVEDGAWLEAPLWIWTSERPSRRRLFVRALDKEIVLSDRELWETRLPLDAEGDAGRAVERLVELQRNGGVRIRPRALLTTLWARLFLCDLFLHGIGGAKYDRITDFLIERFFGLPAPTFMVLSATLHLPIERYQGASEDLTAIERELRELAYHGERFLGDAGGEAADWIAEKKRWIATPQTLENAKRRCQAIRQANAALQPWLDARRQRLLERQAQARRALPADRVLARRDYAFCLYPEPTLRSFFLQLLHKTA